MKNSKLLGNYGGGVCFWIKGGGTVMLFAFLSEWEAQTCVLFGRNGSYTSAKERNGDTNQMPLVSGVVCENLKGSGKYGCGVC